MGIEFKTKKIRYAVVGLGHISQSSVLPAFENAARNSTLAALISDDPKKLKTLGRKYGVDSVWNYEQYDDCLRSGNVDAVYIALPNDMHEEYTVRAARAGLHVLCEKPLAVTEKECQAMIEAADESGVKLMTAYRLHFERANLQAVHIVQSGKIGDPRIFNSVFCMQLDDEANIRLQGSNGGPLYDIGIYCLNAARYLFQSEPTQVVALSATGDDPKFTEVDEMVSAVLRFPGDRLATFTCSFGASSVSSYRIVGTKGDLHVEPAYKHAGDLRHIVTVNGRKREREFPKRDQFAPELLYFSKCIIDDEQPEPSGREGLADVRILRAMVRSAERGGEVVEIGAIDRPTRPTLVQEVRKPPVSEPKLVHVRPPSKK